ncbi:TetR family transcriptional regulator [Saccharothrix sp. 6-C]|uniref:TetR family transcriptional regulator n=1 Tax=Saccharothrix texasensis TaxID=103734 RepID=A0A3N1HCM9_9PSEU|nr:MULTISPECIES: TetR family transcriptional regulator [Saccharothrix]QQQ75620.1 TetR family transcriptional regulator [Saccharothrix sp. 6-C]ROP40265.1 TetR family transcriptional regulator [Saccharothrix texasensis]
MATDQGGLRERKKRQTRFALSQAAIRLTLERGWDDVSVEDIAAAANVSERTFRNYFAGKAEAIVATHVERGRRTAEALGDRPADEPLWDALVNAIVAQFEPPPGSDGTVPGPHPAELPAGYPAALQKLLAEPAVQYEVFRAHATAQDELTAAIADRTGTSADDLYPQLVSAVVSAGLGTALTRWTQDPTGSIAAVLRDAFDQIRTGLPDPR